MNSVQNKELTFHNTNFAYMEMGGHIWLTAAEVGQALEYADDKAVQRIYSRHADEFTTQMTGVVKLTTPSGKQESRVFSLRGAHLVAMFARTPKAKEFRRWVLDILDREVAYSPLQFTAEEMTSLAYMWFWMDEAQKVSKEVVPALRQLKSQYAGFFYDLSNETPHFTDIAKSLLIREMSKMDMDAKPTRRSDPRQTLASLKRERILQ